MTDSPTSRGISASLGLGIPAILLGLAILPYLLVRSELPDRLATHFDMSGTADGSSSTTGFFIITLVSVLLGSLGCIVFGVLNRNLPVFVRSTMAFLAAFVAGLTAGIFAGTVLDQRGLDDWTEAGAPWLSVATGLFAALPLGALAARLTVLLTPVQQVEHGELRLLTLAEGEQAVWSATIHSPGLALISLPLGLVGLVVAAGTTWFLAVPTLFTVMAVLSLASIRVRVDRRGLLVNYGLFPWPRTHIPVEKIESATVIDVRPKQWGGWGYRGSLTLMRQAAVVLRAGPGMRIDLRDGRVFAVTIDEPEPGVALLNTEVGRARSAT